MIDEYVIKLIDNLPDNIKNTKKIVKYFTSKIIS